MGGSSLYDEDVLAWAEQQASALRTLASRRDLPNELDLANVIEEIEDVGKSEFHVVESLIGNILFHLILLWADPDAPATRGWIAEITAWNVALQRRISPSMRSRLEMESLWRGAVEIASTRLAVWDEAKASLVQSALDGMQCPFAPGDFPFPKSGVTDAVARIRPAS
jgi:hypothetical protein